MLESNRKLAVFVFLFALVVSPDALAWPTYRGNPERTASDGKPGPAKPNVLWQVPARENFIAAPVPHGDRLLISGLGAFNVGAFHCLTLDPKAPAGKRVLWTKTTPVLKQPTVSSPAVVNDQVIFGDGMHQNHGAMLHCFGLDKGLRLWQLRTPPPDTLVHLEGTPTVIGNLAWTGGGSLGVICIDLDKLTLDGKPVKAADIPKIVDAKWKELQTKYEVEKKKDPDFAIPPSEDDLPKASPAIVWRQGQKKWHVDAPVNLAGGLVLAGSSYLDKEKEGERGLFALDAKTGSVKWQARLKYNPWGGAAVSGKHVVVTGSTIGYYPQLIKGAVGDISCFDLDTGKEIWRKDVQGGVPSCAALADGLAICTATDGKVRAFDLASGERRWFYEAKMPFFAPVAVSAGVVYAGDLNGGVHAINLKDGALLWKLDLGAAPVIAPGMIYGGPAVVGGRVYIATCNHEGIHVGKATVVICIGE
jgi:outer membrane protein assembly factor BamB